MVAWKLILPRGATDHRWFMTNTTITTLMNIKHYFLDCMCGLSPPGMDFTTVPHDADRRGNWSCGKGQGVSVFIFPFFVISFLTQLETSQVVFRHFN